MKRFIIIITTIGMVGSQHGPTTGDPLPDLLRAAEVAVDKQDHPTALSLYTTAETRTADPGGVAFNKGVLLFRQQDYPQAEQFFRRSLADDVIPASRRCRGLFNLGTTLMKRSAGTDVTTLQTAIDCYQLVLRESDDIALTQDAAANLELAKLLWAKAISQQPPKDRDPAWEMPPEVPPPTPKPKSPTTDTSDTGNQTAKKQAKSPEQGDTQTTLKEPPKDFVPEQKQVPGSGGMRVINEDGITTANADELLERTAKRLRAERLKIREDARQGERFRPNDW